jgi:hypothetical protein
LDRHEAIRLVSRAIDSAQSIDLDLLFEQVAPVDGFTDA